jgi:hypothetical protein
VSLTLTYFDDEVALDVVDDGRGFDPTTVAAPGPGGGHGLRGMSERTERLGGRLEVESHLGEGTTIALALPALAPPDGLSPASTPGSAPGSTAVPAPTLGAAPVAVPTPAAAPPPGGSA